LGGGGGGGGGGGTQTAVREARGKFHSDSSENDANTLTLSPYEVPVILRMEFLTIGGGPQDTGTQDILVQLDQLPFERQFKVEGPKKTLCSLLSRKSID